MSAAEPQCAVFLSVRDKATRLPGKVRADICGKPAIVHLIDRIKTAHLAASIVMTTSTNAADDALAEIAAGEGIACFRGSEDDKLQRYLDAAGAHGIDFAAIVDGDDLFCDGTLIDRVIADFRATGADYIVCDGLPVGATPYGIRVEALRHVVEIKDDSDTEVWGGYFTDTGLFATRLLPPGDSRWARPDIRMTLDYPEDLAFFTAVFGALYNPGTVFSFSAIMAFLNAHPEVCALNAGRAAEYAESLAARRTVRLKAGIRP